MRRPVKKPARAGRKPSPLVTRRQLAKLLNVHMMTVTKWEREGMPIAERGRKGKPSRYSQAVVSTWLTAREKAAQNGGALNLVQERANKERWQASLAEQTYAARAGELVNAREVEGRLVEMITRCRTKLLGLPSRIKMALPELTHAQILAIDKRVREDLEDLTVPPVIAKGSAA